MVQACGSSRNLSELARGDRSDDRVGGDAGRQL